MIFRWRGWCLVLLLILLPAPVSSQSDPAVVQVVRVIDGDTIQVCCVFGDRVTVRYVGVDTPEIHHPMKGVEHYGMEASEANRKLVDGKTVSLEFDVEQRDRYGRLHGLYLSERWHLRQRLARGEWLRDGDDRAAECEASGFVPEAPAGGEGGKTEVVEVRPLAIRSIGSNPLLDLLSDSL